MHILKIETAGIQKYIFSSNKLKVNLGASYVNEHLLFKDLLKLACKDIESAGSIIDNWHQSSSTIDLITNSKDFKIGYIGGGNAVVYGQLDQLKSIEQNIKQKVLEYFPGLEVYTGIVEECNDYKKLNSDLAQQLNINRTNQPFVNKTFNHGFFNKCAITGDVAHCEWKEGEENKWISDEVYTKIQYGEKEHEANKKHEEDLLTAEQRELFTFPLEFEDFSEKDEKSYIAIVHIDGNNLGNAFIDAENLTQTQNLSLNVRSIGTKALKATIQEGIIAKINEVKDTKDGLVIEEGQEKALKNLMKHEKYSFSIGDLQLKITQDKKERSNSVNSYKLHLPIRPIITGGDDITFVCEGSLGVPLAKLFLQKFSEIGNQKRILKNGVYACAGVAIIKQKYPFYRGYQLSEELIKEAKTASRAKDGNYLSFMIAGYGTGTSLEDLKKKYARTDLYNNYFSLEKDDEKSIDKLEELISLFSDKESDKPKVPRNKLIEVRNALVNGNINEVWPTVKSRLTNIGAWNPCEQKAITFDAIELVDFYNKAYLKK
jgi:hypothetical protein